MGRFQLVDGCKRVPVPERFGNNHENERTDLLETLKDTQKSQEISKQALTIRYKYIYH